jgi:hypothetical protein
MRLVPKARLPEPLWNVPVRTADGTLLIRPDGWFDEVAMAWEIDSYAWHMGPADYDRTLRRHALMAGAGIMVLHTLPARLRREPKAVIAELRSTYEQAARRPRPNVVAG